MDVFAHTLWTNALFYTKYKTQRRMRYLAAFFGVAPDLIGFTPLFIYMITSGKIFRGEHFATLISNHWTALFAEEAYKYTHSLVVFAFCFLAVLLIGNTYKYYRNGGTYNFSLQNIWVFWPMLGWPLHILIDIPTHPDFYSTPFLYPLSHFENHHGVAWAHPVFMVINYSLLVTIYIILSRYQRRERARAVVLELPQEILIESPLEPQYADQE